MGQAEGSAQRGAGALLTPEQERWAEALAVERAHGEGTPAFIADRVRALALQGDGNGVQRWRDIAAKFDELQAARLTIQ